ncbi:uncharacterized protein LOC112031522 [Quercus suber]|uniref:uncharacterized protein LOC112031522 n=1 Tax=Quercus suber TaxID=58331 RepID=UPI0032DF0CA5
MSFKIKAPSLKFSRHRNGETRRVVTCRVVRRRVRKTAVSFATLIEEFDSFLGYAYCGMVAAARWIAKLSTPFLLKALDKYPEYKVKVGEERFFIELDESNQVCLKNQRYSRAYINFKRPVDVFDFAEFFVGHVFVNEKGA